MQLYVKAKSKKELNERLAYGVSVFGTKYDVYGELTYELSTLKADATIKIYDKFVGGSPYAKAYGTYSATKGRVL